MSFKQIGKIAQIGETQQVSETFKKRSFLIQEQSGQYTNDFAFELTQDKCSVLDSFEVGQEVEVSFNIRCREWNGKYFTNLNAWRIEAASAQQEQPKQPAQKADKNDKLPF
jgi:hypothetical protein